MIVLSAHQPTYLPFLGTLAKIAAADLFVIFDGVQFERHGYSNRVKIKTQNGPQWLTVPVQHGQPLLKDARIVPGNWRRKHLRAVQLAYQRAPFFQPHFDMLCDIVLGSAGEWTLGTLTGDLLRWLLDEFGIETKVVRASDYDLQGTKSDLVLDMACKLGAKRYIFGKNGRDYANLSAFAEQGIEVEFQEFQQRPYQQMHGPFVPGLSAIDALMNLGPAARDLL